MKQFTYLLLWRHCGAQICNRPKAHLKLRWPCPLTQPAKTHLIRTGVTGSIAVINIHLTATGTHMPYGNGMIRVLTATRQKFCSCLYFSQLKLVLDSSTLEGCKA